jgi:hypothetical protein
MQKLQKLPDSLRGQQYRQWRNDALHQDLPWKLSIQTLSISSAKALLFSKLLVTKRCLGAPKEFSSIPASYPDTFCSSGTHLLLQKQRKDFEKAEECCKEKIWKWHVPKLF